MTEKMIIKRIELPVTKQNVQQKSLLRNLTWTYRETLKSNPKKSWNNVKSKSKNKVGVSDPNTEEGVIVSSDPDKTHVLNTYISGIFTRGQCQYP